jgi:putative tryptophan/tyrosine transport system substrate-binding protein
MRRRDLITLLGGAAAAWPLAARAQQAASPVIGVLDASGTDAPMWEAGFKKGLGELGFSEGRNLVIEYRSGRGPRDQLPAIVTDLVHRQVNVIATNGNAAALAAKAATTTIPIVFLVGGNPIELGLVNSLNRPGGNMTGASLLNTELDSKRLGLLAELAPDATVVGFLVNPENPTTADKIEAMRVAGSSLRRELQILNAHTEVEIDAAFASIPQRGIRALVITSDIFFSGQAHRIAALTNRYAVPVISAYRDAPANGGLMSYGGDTDDSYRQQGIYVGRILKGEKPNDLPVVQSTKFNLVINLKTARVLGLSVPPLLLAIADEVIE